MLKNEKLYKILVAITLILPVSVVLFIQATILGIDPVAEIKIPVGTYQTKDTEDGVFIYTDDIEATIEGLIIYNEEVGSFGVNVGRDDIIKINRHYKGFVFNEETKEFEFVDIKLLKLKEKKGIAFSINTIFTLVGVLLAVGVISGKMEFHKKYPREAALLALVTITVVLFILDAFISGIKGAFVAVTGSWVVYYMEYRARQNLIVEKVKDEKEKKASDKLAKLEAFINEN